MFIYRKENALSSELCRAFINAYKDSDEKAPGQPSEKKKSTDITFNPNYLNHNVWGPLLKELIPIIEKESANYVDRHLTAFQSLDAFEIFTLFNLQRYEPGEGFYNWHCERASIKYGNRVLVWMVYLNTILDRGETEFFYQHHFESATEGKLIIWPSDWTHLHRGVPSPTETKYVLTGWFTHIQKD